MKVFTIRANETDFEIRPMIVEDDLYGDEIVLFHTDLPFESNYQFETCMSRSDFESITDIEEEMGYRDNGESFSNAVSLLLWDEINSFFETEKTE
jgi:hypothetical protein